MVRTPNAREPCRLTAVATPTAMTIAMPTANF
jgi:hypothetical protein